MTKRSPVADFAAQLLIGVCLVAAARAQEAIQEKSRLDALKEEFAEASDAWEKKYTGQRGTPTAHLIERYDAWPAWSFIPRIVKLGTEEPAGPEGFEALKWFVDLSHAVGATDALYFEDDARVMAALRAEHLANPRLIEIFRDCSYYITPGREALLRDCIENGANRDVRGQACYYLAEHLQNKAAYGPLILNGPPDKDDFQRHVTARRSPEFTNYLITIDAAQAGEEAKAVFQRVIDEFGDVTAPRPLPFKPAKTTLSSGVRYRLAQLTAPNLGEPAPELSGKDLSGNEKKLSDYRGKVVVLHFWASWDRLSLEPIPHLQQLAEKHASRDDFCVLGVNYDFKREAAQQLVKDSEISWPSWSTEDIEDSMLGRWSPSGSVPMIVVVDRDGSLRHHGRNDKGLDAAIEDLLPQPADGKSKR